MEIRIIKKNENRYYNYLNKDYVMLDSTLTLRDWRFGHCSQYKAVT